MCTIGLFDTLGFFQARELSLTIDTAGALARAGVSLPTDRGNLILRAGYALLERHALRDASGSPHGCAIHLEKRIPTGGGLGGGSSDAAFTLLALNRLWNVQRTTGELSELAGRLGSDVAFFLNGPSAACSGRGEHVTPLPLPAPRAALLLLPDLAMPTPAVYRELDRISAQRSGPRPMFELYQQWTRLPTQQLLPLLRNDLEEPCFSISPALGRLRQRAEAFLLRPVRLSGSGSSFFTLYDTLSEAENARQKLSEWVKPGREEGLPGVWAEAVALCPSVDLSMQAPDGR